MTVTAGFTTAEINATLEHGGAIEGVVKAEEGGAPVAKVVVCAEEAEETSHCTLTSTSGEYQLEGLAPGSYGVNFFPIASGLFGYSDLRARALQRQAVPRTRRSGDGDAERHHRRRQRRTARSAPRSEGRVTVASSGAPLAGAEACAVAPKGASLFDCAATNSAGEYTITGLPTGSYDIYFAGPESSEYMGQIYNDRQTVASADLVSVTAGGVYPGINAALQVGARITGKVTDATGAPIAGVRVCANAKLEGPFGGACGRTQSAGARRERHQ